MLRPFVETPDDGIVAVLDPVFDFGERVHGITLRHVDLRIQVSSVRGMGGSGPARGARLGLVETVSAGVDDRARGIPHGGHPEKMAATNADLP